MKELFELTNEYDEMLHKGIGLSGENKLYFLEGRVNHLIQQLPHDFSPKTVLDFGCGIGDTTHYLHQKYPQALIIGTDISEEVVKEAHKRYANEQVKFILTDCLQYTDYFDLCYTNGVFHHILPDKRKEVLKTIYTVLKKNAWFSFFENNPLNIATWFVMKRIPFDKHARMLSHFSAQKIILESDFSHIVTVQFLFYFPKFLSLMRSFERLLLTIPLGTQYHILAIK